MTGHFRTLAFMGAIVCACLAMANSADASWGWDVTLDSAYVTTYAWGDYDTFSVLPWGTGSNGFMATVTMTTEDGDQGKFYSETVWDYEASMVWSGSGEPITRKLEISCVGNGYNIITIDLKNESGDTGNARAVLTYTQTLAATIDGEINIGVTYSPSFQLKGIWNEEKHIGDFSGNTGGTSLPYVIPDDIYDGDDVVVDGTKHKEENVEAEMLWLRQSNYTILADVAGKTWWTSGEDEVDYEYTVWQSGEGYIGDEDGNKGYATNGAYVWAQTSSYALMICLDPAP